MDQDKHQKGGSSGSLKQAQQPESSSCGKKRPSSDSSTSGGKKPRTRLASVTFDELGEHVANLENHWNATTGQYKCPVCSRSVSAPRRSKCVRHLVEHLHDKTYHPYKCPVGSCDVTSIRLDVVQRHVISHHWMVWDISTKAASINMEKKAALDKLMADPE